MNKKKIIIISIITILLIGASIGVVLLTSGKENNEEKQLEETSTQNQLKEEVESGSVDTEAITKEAEAKYEENKDKVSCDKKQFTDSYVALIQEGKTSEEAVSSCLATFMNKPDIQVEDETNNNYVDTSNIPELEYDESGIPHIKGEVNTSEFKYREEVTTSDNVYKFFESLGYTLSNPVTESEVRAIYKDYPNSVLQSEFDAFISNDPQLVLMGMAWGILPPSPNGSGKQNVANTSSASSNIVIGSHGESSNNNSQSTWQPSNEPTQPSGPNIDNPNGRPEGIIDGMSEKDNIFK